jgi:hypothetical protein
MSDSEPAGVQIGASVAAVDENSYHGCKHLRAIGNRPSIVLACLLTGQKEYCGDCGVVCRLAHTIVRRCREFQRSYPRSSAAVPTTLKPKDRMPLVYQSIEKSRLIVLLSFDALVAVIAVELFQMADLLAPVQFIESVH